MNNEKTEKTVDIYPSIVVPDRSFLIGAIYGFNAARKRLEENPQPLLGKEEIDDEEPKGIYLGNWLELTCGKCGALYTITEPNELPNSNLICNLKECGNHLIIYGILEPKLWRIGDVTFT